MAIATRPPFLSIRKSKYQRDIASKMKQFCYLIRTPHSFVLKAIPRESYSGIFLISRNFGDSSEIVSVVS